MKPDPSMPAGFPWWPDIAMCWDGKTETAELIIDGITLVGEPERVDEAFGLLCRLRDRAQAAEARLERVRQALDAAWRRGGW